MRTRTKVCGITLETDLLQAIRLGADAIGFVFYENSKRYVTIDQAKRLRELVPAFVSVVALFVNATDEYVQQVIEQVQPDVLQFHGDETPQQCQKYGHRYLRAFRVGGEGLNTPLQVFSEAMRFDSACAWLFDTYSKQYGGSGKAFNHELLSEVLINPKSKAIIVAGGLSPSNVQSVIQNIKPYGVDVSSGVESAPGIKSATLLEQFMQVTSRF